MEKDYIDDMDAANEEYDAENSGSYVWVNPASDQVMFEPEQEYESQNPCAEISLSGPHTSPFMEPPEGSLLVNTNNNVMWQAVSGSDVSLSDLVAKIDHLQEMVDSMLRDEECKKNAMCERGPEEDYGIISVAETRSPVDKYEDAMALLK